MSLAKGPQQLARKPNLMTPAITKPAPQLVQAPARSSATLVSKNLASRIVTGPLTVGAGSAANAMRPNALRKPITRPPKDLTPQRLPKIPTRPVAEPTVASRRPMTKASAPIVSSRKSIMPGSSGAKPTVSIVTGARPKVAMVGVKSAGAVPVAAHVGGKPKSTILRPGGTIVTREGRAAAAAGGCAGVSVVGGAKPAVSSIAASSSGPAKSRGQPARPIVPIVGRDGATARRVCAPGRPNWTNRDATIAGRGRGTTSTIVQRTSLMPAGRPQQTPAYPLISRSGVPIMGRPRRRPMGNPDPYGLDEMTAEDLDFIDDGGEGADTSEWVNELRGVTGYDPSKFRGVDEARESNHSMLAYEERLSEQIARREDLEEFKKAAQEPSSDEEEED